MQKYTSILKMLHCNYRTVQKEPGKKPKTSQADK